MQVSVYNSPFAVLTLIAAPAVFTNATSVLALGTANRLARVVDRTRQLTRELREATSRSDTEMAMWARHLQRLEARAKRLVKAISNFYLAIGSFAAASILSLIGAILANSRHRFAFELLTGLSLLAGTIGIIGMVAGCTLLVGETRLALQSMSEEAQMAQSWLRKD